LIESFRQKQRNRGVIRAIVRFEREKQMKKIGLAVLLVSAVAAVPASAVSSLAVNAGAALNGTNFGLQVIIDPTASNNTFVRSDHPTDETTLEIRFRMRINDLISPQIGPGRILRIANLRADAGAPHKILFIQRQETTGNWRFIAWSLQDTGGGYAFCGSFFLDTYQGTADRQIRCNWTRETAAGGNNGIFRCERTDLPASQFFVRSDLDDFTQQTDAVQFGYFDFDVFAGSGSYDFDEAEIYR